MQAHLISSHVSSITGGALAPAVCVHSRTNATRRPATPLQPHPFHFSTSPPLPFQPTSLVFHPSHLAPPLPSAVDSNPTHNSPFIQSPPLNPPPPSPISTPPHLGPLGYCAALMHQGARGVTVREAQDVACTGAHPVRVQRRRVVERGGEECGLATLKIIVLSGQGRGQ